jgi:hypothetical protein
LGELSRNRVAVWHPVLVVLVVLVGSLPLLSQKVTVEYDKATDFSKFKTYGWVQGLGVANPAMNAYIINAVDYDLQAKGVIRVEPANADLLVTYHAAANTDMDVGGLYMPGTYTGVPVPGYPMWYVPAQLSTSVRYVKKGSLVVEMADRQKQQVVWVAVAKGTVEQKQKDKLDQLDKAVGKMFDKYPVNQK